MEPLSWTWNKGHPKNSQGHRHLCCMMSPEMTKKGSPGSNWWWSWGNGERHRWKLETRTVKKTLPGLSKMKEHLMMVMCKRRKRQVNCLTLSKSMLDSTIFPSRNRERTLVDHVLEIHKKKIACPKVTKPDQSPWLQTPDTRQFKLAKRVVNWLLLIFM